MRKFSRRLNLFAIIMVFLISGCARGPSRRESDSIEKPNPGTSQQIANDPLYKGRKLSEWIKQLEDADWLKRFEAAQAIGEMGADAKDAIPALEKALSDEDVDVRWASAEALGKICDPGAVSPLKKALKDPDPQVRMAACDALAAFGDKARNAVAALNKLVETEEDGNVSVFAHRALAAIEGHEEQHISAMAGFIKDPDVNVCNTAVLCLASMGRESVKATPGLADYFDGGKNLDQISTALCPERPKPKGPTIVTGTPWVSGGSYGSYSSSHGGSNPGVTHVYGKSTGVPSPCNKCSKKK